MSRRKKQLPSEPQFAHITDLTHTGQGVARIDGKTVFIDGALPDEDVEFVYIQKRRQFDEGKLSSVIKSSPDRITPKCRHFGICGGCNLQHLKPEAQIAIKQKILLDNLQRIGHVTPANVLAPITGDIWGYRRKARLGVRLVEKKGKVLVGFRESASRYLADLSQCEVLVPDVGYHLHELGALVGSLSNPHTIPQIEVAFGDTGKALVLRHLEPLSDSDKQKLIEFAKNTQLDIYLQPKGPDSIHALWPEAPVLRYTLPEYGVGYEFLPSDFVQVNASINQKMVSAVIDALDLSPDHNILELFCGLGNFTLPIAKHVSSVVAVEGDPGLIARARTNANNNRISNVTYIAADLMTDIASKDFWKKSAYDRIFLDPPRSGAELAVHEIGKLGTKRVVYVSCNPSTLARDAQILCAQYSYKLHAAGIMDMFPHTAHVESIAIFQKAG
jgi:23S rRNA (uracil1939-C5)-methyltransferase